MTMTMTTAQALDLRVRFDAELATFLDQRTPDWSTGRTAEVFTELRRFILSGGKRLRPLFCYWGWRGAGEPDGDPIVIASAALELFHAFALIHDDIMDSSEQRRGEPSVHRLFADLHVQSRWRGDPESYGQSTALLAGDLCAAWADQMFHECGLRPEQVHRGYNVFAAMRTEVIAGQYLDLAAGMREGSVEGALKVIRMKTARYTITRPLQIGAALAGAQPAVLEALAAFGDPLGDAFQLRDDVLGVFGDPAVTGKPVLDDLREGKPTVMMALVRDRADATQRQQLDELFGNPSLDAEGAARLRAIITETGARGQIEQMIAERAEAAMDALAAAPITEEARVVLAALAGDAIHRDV
ncbi:polyprenyl synthetase family protein [Melissospora conviva]|uniref:polyprenyl synthetase family protein n=1 Tax=Melissospora conviva TaxID=3388432 RepID=UPI003C18435B